MKTEKMLNLSLLMIKKSKKKKIISLLLTICCCAIIPVHAGLFDFIGDLFGSAFSGGSVYDFTRHIKQKAFLGEINKSLAKALEKIEQMKEYKKLQEQALTDLFKTGNVETLTKLSINFDKVFNKGKNLPGNKSLNQNGIQSEFKDNWIIPGKIPSALGIENSLKKEREYGLTVLNAEEKSYFDFKNDLEKISLLNTKVKGEKDSLQLNNVLSMMQTRQKVISLKEDMNKLRYSLKKDKAERDELAIANAKLSACFEKPPVLSGKNEDKVRKEGLINQKLRPLLRF